MEIDLTCQSQPHVDSSYVHASEFKHVPLPSMSLISSLSYVCCHSASAAYVQQLPLMHACLHACLQACEQPAWAFLKCNMQTRPCQRWWLIPSTPVTRCLPAPPSLRYLRSTTTLIPSAVSASPFFCMITVRQVLVDMAWRWGGSGLFILIGKGGVPHVVGMQHSRWLSECTVTAININATHGAACDEALPKRMCGLLPCWHLFKQRM